MRVVEQFVSINGEGTHAGELAVFVRFWGCNLRCSYCDTRWANESDCPYEDKTPEEIFQSVKATHIRNVTLTGGEPLLQKQMQELLELLLADEELRVEVETNGAVFLKPFCGEGRPYFTMDYKLPSSGFEESMCHDNFALLKPEDTVKFVVGTREDLDRMKRIVGQYELDKRCHVYLSPVFGQIEPAEIVEYMIENNMNRVRMQIQMHKVIWDPDRRGV